MSLLEENFATVAVLEPTACVKIQSMLRMLDNYQTRIRLRDAKAGGKAVYFDLVQGTLDELDTCCHQKYITRVGDKLEA